jgi:hypothetical protein
MVRGLNLAPTAVAATGEDCYVWRDRTADRPAVSIRDLQAATDRGRAVVDADVPPAWSSIEGAGRRPAGERDDAAAGGVGVTESS